MTFDCVETREQLLEQGITEAKYLKIKDKGNTGIIRESISNKEQTETLIRNKVKIGFAALKLNTMLKYYSATTGLNLDTTQQNV